jgi:prepilin-type N-terminal cleavage/methylation domain-containing protein
MMQHTRAGFTLIEVLLSVSIITLLAGLSLPVYASFQDRNNLDVTAQSLAIMLRRAQTYARGVAGDSQWGVEIQSTGATLFKGATFAGRTAAFDETTSFPPTLTPSGVSEVIFSTFSAAPSATGNIVLTVNANNIRTVGINAKGVVDY